MNTPEIQITLISNVWIKLMNFKLAGTVNPGHSHIFDHPTLLVKGSVEVEVDGLKTIFKAPHILFIRKEKVHTITSLEDDTLAACIHAIRDGDAIQDIIDPAQIPAGIENFFDISGAKPLAYGLDPRDI